MRVIGIDQRKHTHFTADILFNFIGLSCFGFVLLNANQPKRRSVKYLANKLASSRLTEHKN